MGGSGQGRWPCGRSRVTDLTPCPPTAAAYYLPRHLAPNPTYPHLYPPYLIRGYPDTAALENRQTIINDYITSQQMHHSAATAMAQRADMLRGLSPRESSLALNYATGPRGECGEEARLCRLQVPSERPSVHPGGLRVGCLWACVLCALGWLPLAPGLWCL